MATIEVKVPDIGDYSDVPVIEVLVAVGDTVKKDQGLVTLESDKATLEVPSSAAGVVKEIKVKLGDTLSEGAVVVVLDAEGAAEAPAKAAAPAPAPAAAAPASKPPVTPSHRAPAEPAAPKPALSSGKPADIECEMVVLGSGPGGYTAAFRAADVGLRCWSNATPASAASASTWAAFRPRRCCTPQRSSTKWPTRVISASNSASRPSPWTSCASTRKRSSTS